MSFSEEIGAVSEQYGTEAWSEARMPNSATPSFVAGGEPIHRRTSLIKISYSSWRVCLNFEVVVTALSNLFFTHLLLTQDRGRDELWGKVDSKAIH